MQSTAHNHNSELMHSSIIWL